MREIDRVTVFTSCIWQTNSTIVETDERIFVFDPAYFPQEIGRIVQFVGERRSGRPITLVLTHGDWDHIAGYREFADSTVIAHEAIEQPDRLAGQVEKAKQFDVTYYVNRGHELLIPRIDQLVSADSAASGTEVVGSTTSEEILFLPMPGHTQDMMATYFPQEKVLVAGDMLSDLEFPFIDYDSAAYLTSLQKLKALVKSGKVDLLIPGHGSCTTDRGEMLQRIEQDAAYIESARELVFGLVAKGQTKEQILPAFQELTYRGKGIQTSLMGQHESNLDQLIREANRR